MADFCPDKVFCPNFQIAISQEPQGVSSWNFQSFYISVIPANGAKMKKFWEVRVSCPGWFDMELPFLFFKKDFYEVKASGLRFSFNMLQ